jgi:hypothetical protein
MRFLASLLCCLALLLGGCTAARPQPDERRSAQPLAPPVRLDSAVRLRLDSVRVRTPRSWLHRAVSTVTQVAAAPARIGKKSTVNYYYAPATVITAGKKATVAAGAGATALTKPRGQTVTGDGNVVTAPVASAASSLTLFGRLKLWATNAGEALLLGLALLLVLAIIYRKRLVPGFPF